MAVSDGEDVTVVKDMGLVSHVFDDRVLAPLTGHLAIGHTRYSTTGSSTWRNAQPVVPRCRRRRVRARSQRQPGEHRRARRGVGDAARHRHQRQRPRRRAASARRASSSDERRATAHDARAGPDRRAAPPRGRVLVRAHGRRTASSACATPTGSVRCASAG